MADITGMAHLMICLADWQQSAAFYRALLGSDEGGLGFTCVADTERGHGTTYENQPFLYFVGGKTAIGFHAADAEPEPAAANSDDSGTLLRWRQGRAGLHHWCLRARSRDAVDRVAALFDRTLRGLGGKMIRRPEFGPWAAGYYSVLFEDPEGMRVEVNFVPGKGLLQRDKPEVGGSSTSSSDTSTRTTTRARSKL